MYTLSFLDFKEQTLVQSNTIDFDPQFNYDSRNASYRFVLNTLSPEERERLVKLLNTYMDRAFIDTPNQGFIDTICVYTMDEKMCIKYALVTIYPNEIEIEVDSKGLTVCTLKNTEKKRFKRLSMQAKDGAKSSISA